MAPQARGDRRLPGSNCRASRDSPAMQFRPRGGPPKRFGSLTEYPATPRLEKSQGPAPQPPSARRPRRTGQPRRARGRSPPARSRFAAPIMSAPQANCRITQARRRLPGLRSPRPPFHRARPPCGAIAPRGGSARGDSAASPRRRPCGGWKGPGLRRAAHAPLARAATPRPAQVRAHIAGADCARSALRLRSEPERAAQTRRRGAGDSESAVRRIGAPPPRARRRTARPAAPPSGRGAGRNRRGNFPTRIPPPHLAGADVRPQPSGARFAPALACFTDSVPSRLSRPP